MDKTVKLFPIVFQYIMKGLEKILQKRGKEMYNNYPNYYQPQRQVATGLKGRPVSSLDEARATAIDFDGSIFFFPDLANNRIYTKQVNPDGTASLFMYELKEFPIVENNNAKDNFVTREEFTVAIQQIQKALEESQPKKEGGNQNEYKF